LIANNLFKRKGEESAGVRGPAELVEKDQARAGKGEKRRGGAGLQNWKAVGEKGGKPVAGGMVLSEKKEG